MEKHVEQYRERYDGERPRWLVRAPGRINLIGEHTDYNGFPVLPMAIGKAIYVAASPRSDGVVRINSTRPETYGERVFEIGREIPPYDGGDWGNYVKAAVQSLCGLVPAASKEEGKLRGMDCLIAGDIPEGAGLSSSSALVVGAALAFAASNHIELEPESLAARMASAEHYVGTRGGGMDQAVCLLAKRGHALKIDFFPLRAEPVPFPAGCCIVAAHSGVTAHKSDARKAAYNLRVLECRLGTCLLARRLSIPAAERLADLTRGRPGGDVADLLDMLSGVLAGRETLSVADVVSALRAEGCDSAGEELLAQVGAPDGAAEELKILRRCRHVFTEAARVERAAACLASGHMAAMGELMNDSHGSCAEQYEISCPELDELVGIMRRHGALGARLTGAGFGGFVIALTDAARSGNVIEGLEREFYEPRGMNASQSIFIFRPESGALSGTPTGVIRGTSTSGR